MHTRAEKKSNRSLCAASLAILLFFFITAGVRALTLEIAVKRFGISNAFTEFVLSGVQGLDHTHGTDSADRSSLSVSPSSEESKGTENTASRITGYQDRIDAVKTSIETYFTDYLPGYNALTQGERAYRKYIGWNFVCYSEYNGVIKMNDGFLTTVAPKRDSSEQLEALKQFADFCASHGTHLLYVQAPYKVCKITDTTLSGSIDFTNQNADSLLSGLISAGIDVLDLREELHREHLSHHELFYRTDHHWKAETGLWASRHILQTLNARYGYHTDDTLLTDDQFGKTVFPRWFLGAQGKKVTLAQTEPEDIALLYPNYPTSLHYLVPSLGIDREGDFSILYNMNMIKEEPDYTISPYHAYAYGDQPVEQIINLLSQENRKILLIHDSFGDCVIPFVSLGIRQLDAIDLRHFTESLQDYIVSSEPDTVIVMYNCGAIGNAVDYESRKDLFDFR